jgi:hypothetical protein
MPDPRTNRPQHRRRSLFNLTGCASRTKIVVSLVNKAKAPYGPSAKKKTLHAELDLANCGELAPRPCSTLTKYARYVQVACSPSSRCEMAPGFSANRKLARSRDTRAFVGTNPADEPITPGLRVIRPEPAPREFALSDVRPVSLVFRAKADHLIQRAPRRCRPRARNRSRLLVIVHRACSSRSRHESELRATQCCLESAG